MYQKAQATDFLLKKALRETAKLDDGISDANTIAMALSVACYEEYENYIDAVIAASRGLNYVGQAELRRLMSTTQAKLQCYVPVVLSHRSDKYKRKTAAPAR